MDKSSYKKLFLISGFLIIIAAMLCLVNYRRCMLSITKSEYKEYFKPFIERNIDLNITYQELGEVTQEYFDENHKGIQINSKQFDELILNEYFDEKFAFNKKMWENEKFTLPAVYILVYAHDRNLGGEVVAEDDPFVYESEDTLEIILKRQIEKDRKR